MNSIRDLRLLANQISSKTRSKIAWDDFAESKEKKSDTESERFFNGFMQWSTADNNTFFPASSVVKQLPPGYYDIGQTMTGQTYFKKKAVKSEALIKFPDSTTDRVINEIEKFWGLEDEFIASGFLYRRGIALYGPPGSGKTCILRLVIDNLINAHRGVVVDFGSPYTFEAGYEVLRQIHPDMPLVVLMEDLDSILARNSESDVLNLLDGIDDIRKAVFLATTNYPEKLGSRILNRPGRFDKKFFVDMPNREARELFIRSKIGGEEEIQRWADDTDGLSIAHIKELFVATQILGDPYEEALGVLKDMVHTPSSSVFDGYSVISGSNTDWDLFGNGKAYRLAKKAFKK